MSRTNAQGIEYYSDTNFPYFFFRFKNIASDRVSVKQQLVGR